MFLPQQCELVTFCEHQKNKSLYSETNVNVRLETNVKVVIQLFFLLLFGRNYENVFH